MKKTLYGWLEAAASRGTPRRAYCSEACARSAGVRAMKKRWEHPHRGHRAERTLFAMRPHDY
jgi:hypothetical protein